MAGMHDLSDGDLSTELGKAERELVAKRFDLKAQRLANTSSLRGVRRRIAQIHTEARRRELASGLPKGAIGHSARSSATASEPAREAQAAERGGFLAGIVDKLTGKE
jgi:ribosomal protein L29